MEPVFGQIKHRQGFRQFLLRGVHKVRGEWALVCMTHNILKLHRACCTLSGPWDATVNSHWRGQIESVAP